MSSGIKDSGALETKALKGMRRKFDASSEYKVRLNALTKTKLSEMIVNRDVVTTTEHIFSKTLDQWAVTNQKQSGRCWCFAGLNLLRVGAMKKMKVKNFEFSQNWTLFWDKVERANYFLEQIIQTAKKPDGDRVVDFLLSAPIGDGGQWHMFVDIVKKYGLVPQSAMPETESSSCTAQMNGVLITQLRRAACAIRAKRGNAVQMRKLKSKTLEVVYRILCMHLGVPPEKFLWQWRDEEKEFHSRKDMTPHRFAKEYVTLELDDYVCLVNDPRKKHGYYKTYTVDRLGNVVGGRQIVYMNVPMEVMKQATMDTIIDDEPVWFGCDVGKQMQRQLGILDSTIYDFEGFYDTSFEFEKADRLAYGHAAMSHAMLFTGVDVEAGRPRRWRIENSWGAEGGSKGFYVMNDNWFDEHMYEVAIHKKYLSTKVLNALKKKPVVLDPWDPMGALA